MSLIKRVAFNSYPVKDLKRAREFYETVLGLKPGDNFNDTVQEYDIGGTTFSIDSSPMDFSLPGSQNSVSFEVSDLSAWVPALRKNGVPLLLPPEQDVMETPVCFMAFLKDPDGNVVALHETK